MKEFVVISGKGGTGKTSIAASFAVLAGKVVIADCDVDAADMHLLLKPKIVESGDFISGTLAVVNQELCLGCGLCSGYCKFDAIGPVSRQDSTGRVLYVVNDVACEGCGVCAHVCPVKAISLLPERCGEWMISDTRAGSMVHARLGIASENSGKLVSFVRKRAMVIALRKAADYLIVDGPPGTGCPVIAAVTGADAIMVVTEPTVSGRHDLLRVLELARHFSIPASFCVNKWDINPELAADIQQRAIDMGARYCGNIRYDPAVTAAQVKGLTVVETDAVAGEDIRKVWSAFNDGYQSA